MALTKLNIREGQCEQFRETKLLQIHNERSCELEETVGVLTWH